MNKTGKMSSQEKQQQFEEAHAIARLALPFMGENQIPATPENYMIFYFYFEGTLTPVKELVDSYLQSEEPWNEATTKVIFNQLFSSSANLDFLKKNEKLARQVQEMTLGIIKESRNTAEVAQKTSQSITSSLAEVENISEVHDLAGWLKTVLGEVKQVGEASDNLGGALNQKTGHLEKVVASLDKMEAMVLTDELTQLANRRFWDNRLQLEFDRFSRYGNPCALIMLDLDDFKKLNDTHGHNVGDQALREVARILAAGLRNVDFAARFGGEEFTCLLPETSLENAVFVANRLRRALCDTNFTVRGERYLLTASFGVSSFTQADSNPEEALDRADQAMYLAKSQGKNQVCHENELSPEAGLDSTA
ncbi:MAG: GGDEF domain-containing protein [Desulfarculaceae bacterium]|jgi:diguanylate cyclase